MSSIEVIEVLSDCGEEDDASAGGTDDSDKNSTKRGCDAAGGAVVMAKKLDRHASAAGSGGEEPAGDLDCKMPAELACLSARDKKDPRNKKLKRTAADAAAKNKGKSVPPLFDLCYGSDDYDEFDGFFCGRSFYGVDDVPRYEEPTNAASGGGPVRASLSSIQHVVSSDSNNSNNDNKASFTSTSSSSMGGGGGGAAAAEEAACDGKIASSVPIKRRRRESKKRSSKPLPVPSTKGHAEVVIIDNDGGCDDDDDGVIDLEKEGEAAAPADEGGADNDRAAAMRYRRILGPMRFEFCDELCHHSFSKETDASGGDGGGAGNAKNRNNLARELLEYKLNLPVELSSSVFVRAQESKMNLIRALITGTYVGKYTHFFPSLVCSFLDVIVKHD
jgi:hypothetical protein